MSGTLFEGISDDPLEVNMNLANTSSVLKKLKSLNTHKAPGPDDIPNWIHCDYAKNLAPPPPPPRYRCISLTPTLSKVAEEFLVEKYIAPEAVFSILRHPSIIWDESFNFYAPHVG